MRLHFLIFAALNRVPFVALPYSSKVAGFLEDLEIAMPPLKQVNAGQLIAYIDRWWDLRRNLQARLEKSVPEIQNRARRTTEIALRLLTEGGRSGPPRRLADRPELCRRCSGPVSRPPSRWRRAPPRWPRSATSWWWAVAPPASGPPSGRLTPGRT